MTRNDKVRIAVRIAVVVVIDFVLLRIFAPDLVNLHQDWALLGAVACVALALGLTGWLALQIWPYLSPSARPPRSRVLSPHSEDRKPK